MSFILQKNDIKSFSYQRKIIFSWSYYKRWQLAKQTLTSKFISRASLQISIQFNLTIEKSKLWHQNVQAKRWRP